MNAFLFKYIDRLKNRVYISCISCDSTHIRERKLRDDSYRLSGCDSDI